MQCMTSSASSLHSLPLDPMIPALMPWCGSVRLLFISHTLCSLARWILCIPTVAEMPVSRGQANWYLACASLLVLLSPLWPTFSCLGNFWMSQSPRLSSLLILLQTYSCSGVPHLQFKSKTLCWAKEMTQYIKVLVARPVEEHQLYKIVPSYMHELWHIYHTPPQ